MKTSKSQSEPSGVCLLRLIETRMFDIVKAEHLNDDRMCLYETGSYWAAFDHSAYQVKKIFPELSVFVVSHPDFPAAVVGISVPDARVMEYKRRHSVQRKKNDSLEFMVEPLDNRLYLSWHQKEVETFRKKQAEGCVTLG